MGSREWRIGAWAAVALGLAAGAASAQTATRWTDAQPAGVFFNDYDPNFHTGFVPRVQDPKRTKIHLARGNQLRVRMVLPDETIDHYLEDQVAKHDLYQEVIDEEVIELTSNTAWEDYHQKVLDERLHEQAKQSVASTGPERRQLNLEAIDRLNPERLYRIRKDFNAMADRWRELLAASQLGEKPELEDELDLINELFPQRLFVYELSDEQEAAFLELVATAKAGDTPTFRTKAEVFFHDVTGGIYAQNLQAGKLDYWEYTAIYPAGTYDTTTTHGGKRIPMITTPGIWYFMPRMHGNGMIGMVDYISGAGYTEGSRNGKPYNRVALTSRGPVSHGCTRLGSGHLAELRELLPSTSESMQGIVNYRNISHCYDVFDRKGDGNVEIMGVQYYFAFRHTNARVAKQIWAQNNRKDFYEWMYGDEMNYGPIGQVTFDDVCEGKFVGRKTREGKHWQGLTLYEAPYQPETLQFYKIKGVERLSDAGMDFNRELRRVGHGYEVDRAVLRLQ
jgi:hypothetical protein